MILSGTDVFYTGSAELTDSMHNLMRASEQMAMWLVLRGIAPNQLYAIVPPGYSGFEFGFRIDNRHLDGFAAVETDFWEFTRDLVPLRSWFLDSLAKRRFKPLSTVREGADSFLLLVSPDPDSDDYKLPPTEYWMAMRSNYWRNQELDSDLLGTQHNRQVLQVLSMA